MGDHERFWEELDTAVATYLLTTDYVLLTTGYLLLTIHYSLLTTYYELLTTHYLLATFIAYYLLLSQVSTVTSWDELPQWGPPPQGMAAAMDLGADLDIGGARCVKHAVNDKQRRKESMPDGTPSLLHAITQIPRQGMALSSFSSWPLPPSAAVYGSAHKTETDVDPSLFCSSANLGQVES